MSILLYLLLSSLFFFDNYLISLGKLVSNGRLVTTSHAVGGYDFTWFTYYILATGKSRSLFLLPSTSKQTNKQQVQYASKQAYVHHHTYLSPIPDPSFPSSEKLKYPKHPILALFFFYFPSLRPFPSQHMLSTSLLLFLSISFPASTTASLLTGCKKKGEKRRKRKRWESFSDTKSQQWCEHSSTPNKPLFLSVGCSLILQFYGPTTVPKGHSSSATLLAVAFLNVIHGFWSGALIFIDDVDFTFDHPDSFACQEKQEAPRLIARARFFISIVALHCPHEMESKSYTATLRSVLSLFSQPQSNLLEKP